MTDSKLTESIQRKSHTVPLCIICLLGVLAFFVLSCGMAGRKGSVMQIDVESSNGRIEAGWQDSVKVDVWAVHADVPLAPVRSVDVVGKKCFVLDVFNRVFLVDAEKRCVVMANVTFGNARNELISPECLTADNEHVYVYDGMKESIFVFTHDFKLQRVLNTGCSFSSIRKVKGGFACMSMGQTQQFHFLGNDGVVTYSRTLSDIYPDNVPYGSSMQTGMDGSLYVKAYYSDTVYKWNGKELEECLRFAYSSNGSNGVGGGYEKGSQLAHAGVSYTESFFVTGTHVLSSFIESDGRTIHYNLFDKAVRKSRSGKIGLIDNVFFRANLQCGDYAYAVMLSDEAGAYGIKDVDPDCVIVIRYAFPS